MVPTTDQASKLGGEAQRRNSEAVPKATTTFLAPWHRASERETISTNFLPAPKQVQYFGLTLAHVLLLAVVPEKKKSGDKIEPERAGEKFCRSRHRDGQHPGSVSPIVPSMKSLSLEHLVRETVATQCRTRQR